jgi:hypothetical protein
MPRSGERAVTRGGTTYTMNTANIGAARCPHARDIGRRDQAAFRVG